MGVAKDMAQDRELVQKLWRSAIAGGAGAAEAYFAVEEELVIEVRDQSVEDLKAAREQGVGLRVFVGNRLGFAYTTDLSADSLARLAGEAVANARVTHQDRYHVLPEPADYADNLEVFDPQLEQVPLEAKIELAMGLERTGRGYDHRVRVTESSVYQESVYHIVVANSRDLMGAYRGSSCGLYAVLVATDGVSSETGYDFQFSLKYDDLKPEEVGRKAAAKAVQMLGAQPVTSRRVPVVMDPYVAINFLGILTPSFSADAVQKGRSLLAGKLDQKIGGAGVTIIDDGLMPGGLASAPFDGEGVPSRRNVLVEEGVLRGYLHNSYTAAKAGVGSTGNATRGSFRGLPGVGTTNCYLAPGQEEPEGLVKGISNGIFLTEVMGMHTANPVSGDFSVGAAGRLIENGELTAPVRGIAVAGNIAELLGMVEACGRDLTFMGGRGAPTTVIGKMTVSG